MVLYNATTVYELVKNKYSEDFKELGAGALFEDAIRELQAAFFRNLGSFRHYVASELDGKLKSINLAEMVD